MSRSTGTERAGRLVGLLGNSDPSIRLRAALAAGTEPDPALAPELVARFADEPDFFVRDMLTWALIRQPPADTIPLLLGELGSSSPRARSQSLHTLSKIGEPRTWGAITDVLLEDPDDDVARAAWRAAVILVPDGERAQLAARLVGQLGRGDLEVQRSLSRAFVELGGPAWVVLDAAAGDGAAVGDPTAGDVAPRADSAPPADSAPRADSAIRAHARATLHLLDDPESAFGYALDEANRELALEFRRRETG